jgi:hypothetical protein
MTYDGTFNISSAFNAKQKHLRGILEAGRENGTHPGAVGDGSELSWKDMLTDFLPSRYSVAKGFVVDSNNKCSEQIDIIIYDRNFSPLLWELGSHLYIPAESVYAVFEVKQEHSAAYFTAASEKAASVRQLHRTQASFGWLGGKGTKEPFAILAGLLSGTSSWTPAFGDSFHKALAATSGDGQLDLGCALASGSWDLENYDNTRSAFISPADSALMSFCMHLLHRLQKMGSVGGIDYNIYEQAGGLTQSNDASANPTGN